MGKLFPPNGICTDISSFGFVKNTLTSVINMIRIKFTVLIFRIIVKEVILKVLPQIQRREWRQKLNLFISYEGDFCRHFVRFSFARRPRKKCTRASHEMAQFVLKIAFGYFAGTNPINGEGIQSFTIGWFSNRTGTSFDDGARKSNNWLDQWQSEKLGTGSRV